jgi:hypothetical protein
MRNQLESIRPIIKDIIIEKKTGTLECFQNHTLRPILKFQNSLILSLFYRHLEKHKTIFHDLTVDKKKEYIEQIIKKDRKLYHLLIGVVLGHVTDSEYQEYIVNENELNRRIINMIIQRIQSQL